MQKILIMGLPGAGKTTLAAALQQRLVIEGRSVTWLNADEVRKQYNDWDFSEAGRIRQSLRMRELADASDTDYVIADFVAPLLDMRKNFAPDWCIWLDTIKQSAYADTNAAFSKPLIYDFRITEQNAAKWADIIAPHILDNHSRLCYNWHDLVGVQ